MRTHALPDSIFCLITLVALLALSVGNTSAESLGTTVTYQGQLTEGGLPARGVYDLRFAIYDAEDKGARVGPTLTNCAVSVSNGLFTTTLDFGDAVFTGDARWLEIGVCTNGSLAGFTSLRPRQPLTPTPHTLYALTAGTVASVSASDLTSGTIPDERLGGTYSAALRLNNPANSYLGNFTGDGSGLTNLVSRDGGTGTNLISLTNFYGLGRITSIGLSSGTNKHAFLEEGALWLSAGTFGGDGQSLYGGSINWLYPGQTNFYDGMTPSAKIQQFENWGHSPLNRTLLVTGGNIRLETSFNTTKQGHYILFGSEDAWDLVMVNASGPLGGDGPGTFNHSLPLTFLTYGMDPANNAIPGLPGIMGYSVENNIGKIYGPGGSGAVMGELWFLSRVPQAALGGNFSNYPGQVVFKMHTNSVEFLGDAIMNGGTFSGNGSGLTNLTGVQFKGMAALAANQTFTGNNTFAANQQINGNLGIGITPARKLHVSDVMRLEPRASPPVSPAEGDLYYDRTLHKLRAYDGTVWQNCW